MSTDKHNRKCRACGSEVELSLHQMRAADEPSTETWSCGNCPIDESRIRFSEPVSRKHTSFPRVVHLRSASNATYLYDVRAALCSYAELVLSDLPPQFLELEPVNNTRHSCSVSGENGRKVLAHEYDTGIYARETVSLKDETPLSPKCKVIRVNSYRSNSVHSSSNVQRDGVVRLVEDERGYDIYVYSRTISTRLIHTAVVKLDSFDSNKRHSALVFLHSIQQCWPDIRGFVSRDYISFINNLSPRAWDSRRIQKKGAVYSPKVDGERAYVLVYRGVAHMFSRGKGYAHIGWRVLRDECTSPKPVVIDVENTLSYGCFFIDMLTDRKGNPSPKIRDYNWSLKEILWLRERADISFVHFKPYYGTLKEAESACSSSRYPTDGVVALWQGDTTARKMKQERSIELELGENGNLITSDGDVVVESAPVPSTIEQGSIVEVRFKLNKNGSSISAKPIFKRTDKASANSTAAVSSVLESFSCVSRSDETRRRNVTMWCESLTSALVREAISRCGDKKIVLDIGSGTGQSLDSLTADRGVSYILVEPDKLKCEQLKRRAGAGKIHTDPKDILSNVRALKSGLQTYMVLCCKLGDVLSDEDLMSAVHSEIGAAVATFSAQFVIPDLYELSTCWNIPVVGCFYPYDNTPVSGFLVNSLGIKMKRERENECSVIWGSDKVYTEPYTTVAEYQAFSSVQRASEVLQVPGEQFDEEVFKVCSSVYVIL